MIQLLIAVHNQSVSSHLVILQTDLVQTTKIVAKIRRSPLTKGKVNFSVLEFNSLVMLAATTVYVQEQSTILRTHAYMHTHTEIHM